MCRGEKQKRNGFLKSVSDSGLGKNRDKASREKRKHFDFLSYIMAKKNDYGKKEQNEEKTRNQLGARVS